MVNRMAAALATTAAVLGLLGAPDSASAEVPTEAIRTAISNAIPLLQAGASGSAEHRKCFTCHSQAVPALALVEARNRGFEINEEILDQQLKHTLAHLKKGQKNYSEGRGQGGGVLTAGYALWTLESGNQNSNELTAAVTHYLLEYQSKSNRWRQSSDRPPSSGSDFTASYLALRGLAVFGTEEQQSSIRSRTTRVGKWILEQDPVETEDRVFRLMSMPYIQAESDAIQSATSALIASQRQDGGWAQLEDMESDPYATATAMVALQRAGKLGAEHPVIQQGIQYLLRHQLADGSWHVATRANPIQTYFESGFPHGSDQFISIAASAWATLALSLSLPSD